MTKKYLKAGVALAMSAALLAPTTANVYATTIIPKLQTQKTPKQKFDEAVIRAELAFDKYDKARLNDMRYINATSKPRLDFNAYVDTLEKTVKLYKGKTYTNEDDYTFYASYIDDVVASVESRYNNLDGKIVYGDELYNLTREVFTFQGTDAYKKAGTKLQNAYLDAIKLGNTTLALGAGNISNTQNQAAITAINNAKNDINNAYEATSAKVSLKDEVDLSDVIVKDKDKYTKESYSNFDVAYINAKSTLDNQSSTLSQIKSSTQNLANARRALVKLETPADIKRAADIKMLEEAVEQSRLTRESAKLLFRITPKTAQKNMGKLNQLIKESEELEKEAIAKINELKGIKG